MLHNGSDDVKYFDDSHIVIENGMGESIGVFNQTVLLFWSGHEIFCLKVQLLKFCSRIFSDTSRMLTGRTWVI